MQNFSINVQAVGGPNLEILNIEACWLGSVHDARISDNSCLCTQFKCGDGGYPCQESHDTTCRYVVQIQTRNSIERMFGTRLTT